MFSLGRAELPPAQMYLQARQLVDENKFEGALKLAAKLRKHEFSGAFEIEALVYRARGNLQRAVEVLEEGLGIKSDVWPNLLLLGSILSEMGHFEEAMGAYSEALQCPGVKVAWVYYNQAIALSKLDRYEEALEICPTDSDDPMLMSLLDVFRLGLLNELGRQTKVVELARFLLDEIEAAGPDAEGMPRRSDVHYQLGWAYYYGQQDAYSAREQAELCLHYDPSNKDAKALLEDIDNPNG